ncbi:LysR family transcriptional regulator [Candidimonas nitroreducens]|uniref:LysR family transcriptional regulator n=1 Tax=Candidimonas nitroreducens TaxID=683354 RepID=A0A225MWM8_9BURK|nr:LysR family transcriptional regulator [Candidimonas nitroreducens]OWT65668.1 LysR family transcriptional regulator [Candidimonas nitroreducens]
MQAVDLNLLTALDVLLSEQSVTKAAHRLGLSPSAMSRTLSRLRAATGDQLLVQAGRTLVPTPHAERLGLHVHELARNARAVLQPVSTAPDIARLERTFTIRANDGFVDLLGAPLATAIGRAAPHVRIRYIAKHDKDAQALREGMIDLEIGVIGTAAPELKTRLLFHDRFVGICRAGHPLLQKPGVTPKHYAGYRHVVVSRKRQFAGPVDDALGQLGLRRTIVMVVPTYANAMQIVRHSDLLGLIPHSSLGSAAGSHAANEGLQYFELPVRTPRIKISAIWHPRLHADPAHRWLRDTILEVCRSTGVAG